MWQAVPESYRPITCASTIKECDSVMFPNVFKLLKIACTLCITSCECERSASVIRRLDNFMRHSMGQERLTSLALMHIHYNMEVDLGEAVNIFSDLHPRKLGFNSVLI